MKQTSSIEGKDSLNNAATVTNNLRVIAIAAASLVVGVFSAGVYFESMRTEMTNTATASTKNTADIVVIQKDVKHLTDRMDQLKTWTASHASASAASDDKNASFCPEGSYMTGVSAISTKSPNCPDCVAGLKAICRPLNSE